MCSWSSQKRLTQEAFFLCSLGPLHGQAGHALPPAEEQPSGEPFPTALSLCRRRATFASTLSKCHDEAHRPPSTHMVHFLCEGFSHLPLLSSLQPSPTAMSLAPTPAPEHWLSWPQTLLSRPASSSCSPRLRRLTRLALNLPQALLAMLSQQ